MSNYYYKSTGTDELCNAMEGYYEEEPPRPHPFCKCYIQSVGDTSETGSSRGAEGCYNYSLSDYKIEIPDPDSGDGEMSLNYEIECVNYKGEVVGGMSGTKTNTVNYPKGTPTSDMLSDFMDWQDDMVMEIEDEADSICDDCPPPNYS